MGVGLRRRPIHLAKLTLLNFRNLSDTTLDLNPGLTIIQGANGQGKSNLLEAAFILTVAKSPRAAADRELISWDLLQNGGHAQVGGYARQSESTSHVQIDFEVAPPVHPEDVTASIRKSLRVNGVITPAADFVGAVNVIAFAAEDISLVAGSPGDRRKYLDILISQTDPAYLRTLQRYGRVVTQRNHLLRLVRERRASDEELEFWDQRLASEGAAIVDRRRRAVDRLLVYAVPAHRDLAGTGPPLGIEYLPKLDEQNRAVPAAQPRELAERMLNAMRVLRPRELGQGVSVIGPHRDELLITLGGQSAGAFASRGQARTIALALRLAEASFVEQATGRKPVLALDDVLSELDEDRRNRVMLASRHYDQTLLTTTDETLVGEKFRAGASRLSIAAGSVARTDG